MLPKLLRFATISTVTVLLTTVCHAQKSTTGTTTMTQKDWCNKPVNVISWSFSAQGPSEKVVAGGAAASEVPPVLFPVQIVKPFDECSAAMLRSFNGFRPGTFLTLVNFGDNNLPLLTIELVNLRVSLYVLGDTSGGKGDLGPVETITVTYDRVTIRNDTNGARFCWDAKTQKSC